MDAASLFFKKIKEKLGYMIKGIYFCKRKQNYFCTHT